MLGSVRPSLSRLIDTHCNIPHFLRSFSPLICSRSDSSMELKKLTESQQTLYSYFKSAHLHQLKKQDLFALQQKYEIRALLNVCSDINEIDKTVQLLDDYDVLSRTFGPPISLSSSDSHQNEHTTISFPELYVSYGFHPLYGYAWSPQNRKKVAKAMSHPRCVAYGELGLDYHDFGETNPPYAKPDLQREIFETQLQEALNYGKPLILHTRESFLSYKAEEDTFKLMQKYIPSDYPIHVHCFTSTLDFAKLLLSNYTNLYIGLSGIVTYKTAAHLLEIAKFCPLDRLMIETDSPFLAPSPYRSYPSHTGHLPNTARAVAHARGVSPEEILCANYDNAKTLFRLENL